MGWVEGVRVRSFWRVWSGGYGFGYTGFRFRFLGLVLVSYLVCRFYVFIERGVVFIFLSLYWVR